jgi:hypothetical protein
MPGGREATVTLRTLVLLPVMTLHVDFQPLWNAEFHAAHFTNFFLLPVNDGMLGEVYLNFERAVAARVLTDKGPLFRMPLHVVA